MTDKLSRRQFVRRTAAATGAMAAGLHAPAIVKAAAADRWGDLVGRFVYDGKPPVRKKLKVDKDLECCGKFAEAGKIRDESLMVGPDGGLGNVYVYVRSRSVDVCPELAETVEPRVLLENRDCIFIPHCLKIWYNKQEFYTTNSQPIADNVAFSPLGDVPANIILPAAKDRDTEATWRFRRKQRIPIPITCNYHPWEIGYILPLDHPYVDISKMDGTFKIPKLPAGEVELQVWHEKIGYLNTPKWEKGRLKIAITPEGHDLGTIKVDPSWLVKT